MGYWGKIAIWFSTILFAVIVPFLIAIFDPPRSYSMLVLVFCLCIVFFVGLVTTRIREGENGPLGRAGDYVRELFRAKYLMLVATIVGGFFSLTVLITATLTIPEGPQWSGPKSGDDLATHGESKTDENILSPLPKLEPMTSADALGPSAAPSPVDPNGAQGANSQPQTAAKPTTVPTRKSGAGALAWKQQQAERAEVKWQEQFPGAVAAFWGGFATILAVGIFYRKIAPYTDLWELTEEISNDINNLRNSTSKSKEIYWCYPGFALGRFRTLDDNGQRTHEWRLFENFKITLATAFADTDVKVKALVYNDDCLDAFYRSYSFQSLSHRDPNSFSLSDPTDLEAVAQDICGIPVSQRIQKCIDSEHEMIAFADAGQNSSTEIFKVKSPSALPEPVFVIGNVVYQVSNYGSPIFMASESQSLCDVFGRIKGVFFPSEGRGSAHLVQLVAYRRDDVGFAASVRHQLDGHLTAASCAKMV